MTNSILKRAARLTVPVGLWTWLRDHLSGPGTLRQNFQAGRVRARVNAGKADGDGYYPCAGFRVHAPSAAMFASLYEEIYIDRIYHFETGTPDPVVVDCGANIGMSVLFFKQLYPNAQITCFEADPVVFEYLGENLRANGITRVDAIHGAIGAGGDSAVLRSDGQSGSFLSQFQPSTDRGDLPSFNVPAASLRAALDRRVDFLKIDIEGAEYEALLEAGDRIRNVDQMVIEYHHAPLLQPKLHRILTLLHDHGFDYLLWGKYGVLPPFRLDSDSWYDLILYARRTTGD